MSKRARTAPGLAALGLLFVFLALPVLHSPPPASALGAPSPHLVVVMMENKEYSQVIGNSAAPFINTTMVTTGDLHTSYYSATHPSLPNYLVVTSGQYHGCVTDSCTPSTVPGPDLFSQLSSAGISWRAYQESMPSNCYRKGSYGGPGGYVLKHNPAIFYTDVSTSCPTNDVPLTALTTDLAAGTLPAFSFIAPNLYNDMHADRNTAPCALGSAVNDEVCQGDQWLSAWVPQLLSDGGRNDVTLMLTFDEGTSNQGGGGRVVLLEDGASTPCSGCTDPGPSNHYGLSQAIDDWFGLPELHPDAVHL